MAAMAGLAFRLQNLLDLKEYFFFTGDVVNVSDDNQEEKADQDEDEYVCQDE
jgi:hypothetical protein